MRELKQCRRIVIKAGTGILSSRNGRFSQARLAKIGRQVLELLGQHKDVVLVTSGAIGLGMDVRGLKQRPHDMAVLQACAAIGQGKLIHAYEKFFSRYGVHTAQILLTRDGLEERKRFLKARQTLEVLLRMKMLPIINENDTVATDEIRFGDNDVLSVQVAHLIHADLLIMLSDVDGFHLKDNSRVREVFAEDEIDQTLMSHLREKKTQKSIGGMKAKLEAARVAMRLGLPLLMVDGYQDGIIGNALQGADAGTLFLPGKGGKSARKKWIAFSAARRGTVVVDDGAHHALQSRKKSLLARGIVKARGNFSVKDVVELETISGRVFGRGVVRYTSRDLALIIGKKSDEIQAAIGHKVQDEVIHRNDLVLWG